MTLLESVIMGLIQGLTEFLPVSSSGHLALFKILFHVETETGMLFDVLLHLGTLVAIFVAFYKDIAQLIKEGFSILRDCVLNTCIFFRNIVHGEDKPYYKVVNNSYRKMVMLVIVSTIPTGIIGYTAADVVEASSAILLVPGICLIITGILLLISDFLPDGRKTPRNVTYANAFIIGICQGFATLPGLSRSGTTISACLISGFNRKFAVKYSFIMSIPAVLGAVVLELKDASSLKIVPTDILYNAVGMAVAAIVGYICIKTMLVVVKKKKFIFFSIYCFIIGIVSIAGYFLAA